MTDEEAMALSDCGRGCYIIGGPWISYDPDCPIHGNEARQKEREPSELDEAVRLLERCEQHMYNPFEPDNQSKLYNDLRAYLAKHADS